MKLHSTDEHAKRMLANTSQAGCALTRDQLEDFHRGYERLKSSLTNVKQELEVTFSRWTDFEQMFDELNAWIKDTEMRMTSDAELKTDILEKKAHLEKMKVRCFFIQTVRCFVKIYHNNCLVICVPGSVMLLWYLE